MEGPTGKHIVLILARELAVNIATPLFLVDAAGTLVFYNESAERLLGRPFRATGELPADQWSELFRAESVDGAALAADDRPLTTALQTLRPTHRTMVIISGDGERRKLVITAYPLLATADRAVGAIAIFWEARAGETGWDG
jgi:PAS domain-containing protein